MIIGTLLNGKKCVYDLPERIQGQPLLLGLSGPMYNGMGMLKKSGEKVAVIRYEKHVIRK